LIQEHFHWISETARWKRWVACVLFVS